MCADIFKFPGKPKEVELLPAEIALAALKTAFEIHKMIVDRIVAGDFDGDLADRANALCKMLSARYGGELAGMAQAAFEAIYGCDPYTFLDHVTSYRG